MKISDPYILLSFINTKLRDEDIDFDVFLDKYDYSREEVTEKLSSIGYRYDVEKNQFKEKN